MVTSRPQVDGMVAQAAAQLGGLNARNAGNLSGGARNTSLVHMSETLAVPRGNAICRMVEAAEVAYVTAFLASDKAWAISGELIVASGGAGRSVFY